MTTRARNISWIVFGTVVILLVPLVAMQFSDVVSWDPADFLVMGALLLGAGFTYEFIAKRSEKAQYRSAFAVALFTAFLLAWVNAAVGVIGSEDQPANQLYAVVFAVGFIGSLAARFKPKGMAVTLLLAAIVQFLVPWAGLVIWPETSWGGTGMSGVLILNTFFVGMFAVSAMLFRRAADVRT